MRYGITVRLLYLTKHLGWFVRCGAADRRKWGAADVKQKLKGADDQVEPTTSVVASSGSRRGRLERSFSRSVLFLLDDWIANRHAIYTANNEQR